MALVTKTFNLELSPGGCPDTVITASQGDIGRPFEASLFWGGEPWSADGYDVALRGRKTDGTVFEYDTPTVDGNKVSFVTAEQMTVIPGAVECELAFSDDGIEVATANFVLIVEASPYLPQYCFRACSSLTNVELPSDYTGKLGFGCFASCSNLEMIDCQKTQEIPGYCFNGSSSLTTIVIRRTSVATLSNISAFTGTPFASGGSGGTLYVPNDLISSYQSASNWSTILGYANNQIKKIEGSIYE